MENNIATRVAERGAPLDHVLGGGFPRDVCGGVRHRKGRKELLVSEFGRQQIYTTVIISLVTNVKISKRNLFMGDK